MERSYLGAAARQLRPSQCRNAVAREGCSRAPGEDVGVMMMGRWCEWVLTLCWVKGCVGVTTALPSVCTILPREVAVPFGTIVSPLPFGHCMPSPPSVH